MWYIVEGCDRQEMGMTQRKWCGTGGRDVVHGKSIWYKGEGCGTRERDVVHGRGVWYMGEGCGTRERGARCKMP